MAFRTLGTIHETQGIEHRLAATLATDGVGYYRLTSTEEEGTLATLMDLRRDLLGPSMEARRGQIVETMGDEILVELSSVVAAVECAIPIQRGSHNTLL